MRVPGSIVRVAPLVTYTFAVVASPIWCTVSLWNVRSAVIDALTTTRSGGICTGPRPGMLSPTTATVVPTLLLAIATTSSTLMMPSGLPVPGSTPGRGHTPVPPLTGRTLPAMTASRLVASISAVTPTDTFAMYTTSSTLMLPSSVASPYLRLGAYWPGDIATLLFQAE